MFRGAVSEHIGCSIPLWDPPETPKRGVWGCHPGVYFRPFWCYGYPPRTGILGFMILLFWGLADSLIPRSEHARHPLLDLLRYSFRGDSRLPQGWYALRGIPTGIPSTQLCCGEKRESSKTSQHSTGCAAQTFHAAQDSVAHTLPTAGHLRSSRTLRL